MSTYSGLVSEFLARGFDGLEDDPRLENWVNRGVRRLCSIAMWPFLEVHLANQSTPCALGEFRTIRRVAVTGRPGVLDHVPTPVDRTLTGTAAGFWIDGPNSAILPFPLEAGVHFDVDLIRRHPWILPDDSTDVLVPDDFIDTVLDAICLEASKDLREWENVAGFKTEFADGLAIMRDVLIDPQVVTPRFIDAPDGW